MIRRTIKVRTCKDRMLRNLYVHDNRMYIHSVVFTSKI